MLKNHNIKDNMFKTSIATMIGSAIAADIAPGLDHSEPIFPQMSRFISLAAKDYLYGGVQQPMELDAKTDVPC